MSIQKIWKKIHREERSLKIRVILAQSRANGLKLNRNNVGIVNYMYRPLQLEKCPSFHFTDQPWQRLWRPFQDCLEKPECVGVLVTLSSRTRPSFGSAKASPCHRRWGQYIHSIWFKRDFVFEFSTYRKSLICICQNFSTRFLDVSYFLAPVIGETSALALVVWSFIDKIEFT